MKRERILPTIGFTLLIVCFAVALVRVVHNQHTADKPGQVIIRIAHWQLESGIRGAFDQLARDYERLHPGVRIEQDPIPESIYASWLQTQLVGGTAPDLIEISSAVTDEMAARFFVPITDSMERPNPYNQGTSLANTRWRDTFIGGLDTGGGYRPNLLEYYGAPLSLFTVRMYYNRTLWKRILGDTPPPADYDDFVSICQRVQQYATSTGKTLFPIAGSKYGTPFFSDALMGSQTQRLAQSIDDTHTIKPNGTDSALKFLSGQWNLTDSSVATGLKLARQIGRFAQPGFVQAERDDATFYFMQGRSLMIITGSWDAPSFRALAPFEVGAFVLPIPTHDDPHFGAGVLGPLSEADIVPGSVFGLTRASPHPAQALDFLHYITSRQGDTTFSNVSSWLPAVVGVPIPPLVKAFEPVTEGYVYGFTLGAGGGSDVQRVVANNLGALFDPNTTIASFQGTFAAQLPGAIRSDLRRSVKQATINTARLDSLLGAQVVLREQHPAEPKYLRKESEILEAQTMQELSNAWINRQLTVLPQ